MSKPVAIVGSSGLVGSHILTTLLSSPSKDPIVAYTRRPLALSPTPLNLTNITSIDSSTWLTHLSSIPSTQVPQIFYSSLGTTKSAAGSLASQRLIDYDLSLSIARTAKAAGVQTFVFISGATTALTRTSPFVKIKIELETAIKDLKFANTVIIKPGLIVGNRNESRPAEAMLRGLAKGLGWVSGGRLKDGWAQDADVIAKASVIAGERASKDLESRKGGETRVWEIEMSEILHLGRAKGG